MSPPPGQFRLCRCSYPRRWSEITGPMNGSGQCRKADVHLPASPPWVQQLIPRRVGRNNQPPRTVHRCPEVRYADWTIV